MDNSTFLKRFVRFLKNHEWIIIIFIMFISLIMGVIGYYQYFKLAKIAHTLFEPLYSAMQLFMMGSYPYYPDKLPVILIIARFTAPITLWVAAIKTIFLVGKEQINLIKLLRFKDHIVVTGLNEASIILLRTLKSKSKIVVIESNKNNKYIDLLKQQGIIVISGNPTDAQLLQKVRLDSARYLICFAEDAINISTSMVACQNTQIQLNPDLTAFVHISRLNIMNELNNLDFFSEVNSNKYNFDLRTFNIYERAARLIFNKFAPDNFFPIHENTTQQAHILIVGFSQLGESLLVQAARMGHYANLAKLRVTVIDKDLEHARQRFLVNYPYISEIIDFDFIETNLETFGTTIMTQIEEKSPINCTYICLNSDNQSLTFLNLYQPFAIGTNNSIVLCMKDSDSLLNFLPENEATNINKFLLMEETCTQDAIINERIDDMAKSIHSEYIRKQKVAGTFNPQKASHRYWKDLSIDFKEQNRNQADNIFVKVRALGAEIVSLKDKEPEFDFTKDKHLVELLSKMEHNRWAAHLWIKGWKHGEVRNDAQKIHTDLIPYAQLSEPVKQYDRDTILNIPSLLASLGKKIVKKEG